MIAISFGTRPEIIKVASVIKELTLKKIPFITIFTGQHKELYEDVKSLIPTPNYNLNIMKENQTLNDILSEISKKLSKILIDNKVKTLIVQGDTSTAMTSALVAFNLKIKIGHVEAGLRTHDIYNPYPEEANRQIISRIAHFNWAPTLLSKENLVKENLKNITVTGNTVTDICFSFKHPISYKNKILVTLHRRENFGEKMETMFKEIDSLAKDNPEIEFIFPMHPNPNIQKLKPLLKHVKVVKPFTYPEMMQFISSCLCVISDSGGIQEECGAFKKRILVCRTTTERPEGVNAGFAKLIGVKIKENFNWAIQKEKWIGENPYGAGNAGKLIVEELIKEL